MSGAAGETPTSTGDPRAPQETSSAWRRKWLSLPSHQPPSEIAAGVTGAPGAGMSPEPRAQEVGGWRGRPRSCLARPRAAGRPLELALPILRVAPCCQERNLTSSAPLFPPRPAPVIPGSRPCTATCRVSSRPPTPAGVGSRRPRKRSGRLPDPRAPRGPRRGAGPTLHPLHLFLGLRPDRPGLR